MKIFITTNNVNTIFIYKVLNFIRSQCSEKEFLVYVEEVIKNYQNRD